MKEPVVHKKYRSLLIQTDRQKTITLLFRYPDKEFSLSELAKEAGIAKANAGIILKELKEMGLIEITKLTKIWRIRANQSNLDFIKYKIINNLFRIYDSGLVEFLNDYYKNPKAIILFGSFRKGDDISTSDIDIAVELGGVSGYRIESPRAIGEFEEDIGRKINIHLFSRESIDLNLFNNIANGIVLYGFLEVKK